VNQSSSINADRDNPPNVISIVNSRAADTPAAGAVFQGVGEDVSRYGRVGVAVKSSNASDGVLTMEVSHDNVTWGGPTRTWADTRFGQPHMWNIVEKYFRIKYTNGNSEARDLSLQVQYSVNADIILGHQLNEVLTDDTEGIATRSVLVGKNPDGDYKNVGIDMNGLLQVESTDKFTHLLVEMVKEQRKTNQFLQFIAGDELLNDIEEF